MAGVPFSISTHAHECLARQGFLSGRLAVIFNNPIQADSIQLMAILVLGFLAFPPMTFFVALYLQELPKYSALMTAVHMLPMAVSGIVVNVGFQNQARCIDDIDDPF